MHVLSWVFLGVLGGYRTWTTGNATRTRPSALLDKPAVAPAAALIRQQRLKSGLDEMMVGRKRARHLPLIHHDEADGVAQ